MERDHLVDNASDPKQVKEGRETKEPERLLFLLDLRNALAHQEVRKVLWKWIDRCGVSKMSYKPGQDAATTAFYEGERNIGNLIMADWQEADLQSFFAAMVANRREKEKKNDGRRKAGSGSSGSENSD